MQTISMC